MYWLSSPSRLNSYITLEDAHKAGVWSRVSLLEAPQSSLKWAGRFEARLRLYSVLSRAFKEHATKYQLPHSLAKLDCAPWNKVSMTAVNPLVAIRYVIMQMGICFNSNITLTQLLLKMVFFPLDGHESLIATIRYLWILRVWQTPSPRFTWYGERGQKYG